EAEGAQRQSRVRREPEGARGRLLWATLPPAPPQAPASSSPSGSSGRPGPNVAKRRSATSAAEGPPSGSRDGDLASSGAADSAGGRPGQKTPSGTAPRGAEAGSISPGAASAADSAALRPGQRTPSRSGAAPRGAKGPNEDEADGG